MTPQIKGAGHFSLFICIDKIVLVMGLKWPLFLIIYFKPWFMFREYQSQVSVFKYLWTLCSWSAFIHALQWRHNGRNSISNHQPHNYLLSRLFRCRSKKTSKLCVTGLCAGNSPLTGEFPAQMASNVENVSIWWCHQVLMCPLFRIMCKTMVDQTPHFYKYSATMNHRVM